MGAAEVLPKVISSIPDWAAILGFISGGGFAVFVAVWFMLRLDSRLEKFTEAVTKLEAAVADLGRSEKRSDPIGIRGRGGNRDE